MCRYSPLMNKSKEPPRVMRIRKKNAAPDNRSFQPPRANLAIDNLKPKHIPDSKVWSHEANISIIEAKPMLVKNWVQKTKILSNETNDQAQKIAVKTKFKRIPQRLPGAFKNPAVQKKNLLTPPKTKASVQLPEEIISAPKINKSTKAANVQVQKSIPQEMPVTPKPKLDNDITTLKIKAQVNDTSAAPVNTNNNITPVQTPETKAKPKIPVSEDAPQPNPTEEKKDQDIQKDDKGNTSETTVPAEKQSTDQSKSEEPSKENVELDPLLARAVEEELQDIMIQVWQELPDDPSEEEDRLAVDMLRNEAGDDLRRVLGLNITKRLLNIYNNLFVKMQFTCRPQMGCLTSFLNEYHISKFKRIDKNSNTFAAQMENIEDFDRLCAAKEIMCGEAKVSITPCYKFTQCPQNLKTIYDDTYFHENTVQENTESPKSKNTTQKAKFTASNKNAVKPATKAENVDAKPTDKPGKTESQDIADSMTKDSKCIKNYLENKSANMINDKPEETETKKSIDVVCKDSEDLKNDSTAVEEDKANYTSKIITHDIKSKEKEVTENIMNEKQIHIDILKDKDISEFIVKDKLEIDDDEGDLEGIPECQMEGDEELDDEDILALMSEGVVLDECSGSENEN